MDKVSSAVFAFVAGASVLLGGCGAAAVRATRLPGVAAGKSNSRGVTYYLPQTVVSVSVPVVKTTWSPGLHSDLLPYFFPCPKDILLSDPRPASPPRCGVDTGTYGKAVPGFDLDDATATTRAERDLGQVFTVDYKSRWFQWFVDRKFGIEMSEAGIPGKVTAEATDHTLEFVGQVLKSGAAVYSKALTGGILSAAAPSSDKVQQANAAIASKNYIPCPNASDLQIIFAQYLDKDDYHFFCALKPGDRDQYMKMPEGLQKDFRRYVAPDIASVTTANPPDRSKVTRFLEGFQIFQRIGDAAKKREGLLDGTTGEQAPDVFNARLKLVEDQIAADAADFFGTSRKKTVWIGQFEVRAEAVKVKAFVWDEDKGICDATPGDGVVLAGPAPDLGKCDAQPQKDKRHTYSISLSSANTKVKLENGAAPSVRVASVTLEDASNRNTGFFYRVPGTGKFETFSDDQRTLVQDVAIAQFGNIAALPQSTGGRRSAITLELYGTTGGLKTLSIASDAAVDKSLISDAETAAGSVVDARAAKLKADTPAAADPLADLEKQRKMLEEQLKIKELKEKLGGIDQPDTPKKQ